MPALNDTLTVGLVLILLFGAVSLYLYTRIQQCEQKLNLVESILLDIKMSAELRDYPDLPFKEPVAAAAIQMPGPSSRTPPPTPPRQQELQHTVVPFEDLNEQPLESLPAIDEAHEFVAPMQQHSFVAAAPAPVPAASSRASVGANYESMTLSELKALAQQRNITGAKSMKRNQILEALRTSDRASEASPALQAVSEIPVAPASDGEGFSSLEGTTLTEINA